MGINLERTRSLLRDLREDDPDSDARERLIMGSPERSHMRERAMALMASELLRDPAALVPGEPPLWLVDLSRADDQATNLLFDSRLAELTGRVVDDLVSQGCTADQLVSWLEDPSWTDRAARIRADSPISARSDRDEVAVSR